MAMAAAPMTAPLATAAPTWEALPPEGTLPEYMPPVAPMASAPMAPMPTAPQSKYVSAFEARDRYSGRGSYSGPKKNAWVKYVAIGVFFVLLAGGGGLAYIKRDKWLSKPVESPQVNNTTTGTTGTPGEPAASGPFPRRMLAISIHSYLYANPLHNGDSGFALDESKHTGTDAAVRKLAERWKIPKDQVYHLTDARQAGDKPEPRKKGAKDGDEMKKGEEPVRKTAKALPLKMVMEGAITQFLETSRTQDRIVLVFAGHAIAIKGEAYLVPLEGDLEEVETLIPLKWVYEKLGACKAQEKLIVFDVCRFHPERGIERPHPGPMSEALEKALHEPPDGVTVVSSCSKNEQSIELDQLFIRSFNIDAPGTKGSGIQLHGGFFLSMIHYAATAGALAPEKKLSAPGDELPTERMTKWMTEKVGDVVKFYVDGQTQTVKTTVKPPAQTVAYNSAEAAPGRFEYPVPPPSADPKSVMAIVREIQLPPVKSFRDDAQPPAISDILPFSQETLKDYLAGELQLGERGNAFQQAIIEAVEEMRKLRSSGSGSELPEEFEGETNDRAKEQLRRVQEVPARVEAILQDRLDTLEAKEIVEMKVKQLKRWQVHYEYVVAQLKLRICYVNQYNLALANVRGGKLPDLKPDQKGYRLTAETTLDKNTGAQYKDMFTDARKSLTAIAKDHPNTPWALLAKSDRTVAIGLRLSGSSGSGSTK
jgi:hypothetical protein